MYPTRPLLRLAGSFLTLALVAACGGTSSIKPSEVLDETSGMTVGTLDKPIELVQTGSEPMRERRASFAYLGPVEWDNSGTITYGLWTHIAPGNDWRFADLAAPGAVTLGLDGAGTVLAAFKPPAMARAPYQPVASWGATNYFLVDLDLLRRMAASKRITLQVRTVDDKVFAFAADPEARETLTRFLHARGY